MNSTLQRDMAAYGIDESMLPEHIRNPRDCEVWPEHSDPVAIFLKCSTQWRTGPGGVIGLDYLAVLQIMELCSVTDRRATLDDIQIMENRAIELFHKASKRLKP